MNRVKAKKSLGQHFLKDRNIAARIAESLTGAGYDSVIEIGPGMGILTGFLLGAGASEISINLRNFNLYCPLNFLNSFSLRIEMFRLVFVSSNFFFCVINFLKRFMTIPPQ